MLENILYVSLGAIVGAIARFLITHYSTEFTQGHAFPYGTLIVLLNLMMTNVFCMAGVTLGIWFHGAS